MGTPGIRFLEPFITKGVPINAGKRADVPITEP